MILARISQFPEEDKFILVAVSKKPFDSQIKILMEFSQDHTKIIHLTEENRIEHTRSIPTSSMIFQIMRKKSPTFEFGTNQFLNQIGSKSNLDQESSEIILQAGIKIHSQCFSEIYEFESHDISQLKKLIKTLKNLIKQYSLKAQYKILQKIRSSALTTFYEGKNIYTNETSIIQAISKERFYCANGINLEEQIRTMRQIYRKKLKNIEVFESTQAYYFAMDPATLSCLSDIQFETQEDSKILFDIKLMKEFANSKSIMAASSQGITKMKQSRFKQRNNRLLSSSKIQSINQ